VGPRILLPRDWRTPAGSGRTMCEVRPALDWSVDRGDSVGRGDGVEQVKLELSELVGAPAWRPPFERILSGKPTARVSLGTGTSPTGPCCDGSRCRSLAAAWARPSSSARLRQPSASAVGDEGRSHDEAHARRSELRRRTAGESDRGVGVTPLRSLGRSTRASSAGAPCASSLGWRCPTPKARGSQPLRVRPFDSSKIWWPPRARATPRRR
jgi:hypothetical protein